MNRADTSPESDAATRIAARFVADTSPDHEGLSNEPPVAHEGEWHASSQDAVGATWREPHAKKAQRVEHHGHGEATTDGESAQRCHRLSLDTARTKGGDRPDRWSKLQQA
jgi:hypothetical protein